MEGEGERSQFTQRTRARHPSTSLIEFREWPRASVGCSGAMPVILSEWSLIWTTAAEFKSCAAVALSSRFRPGRLPLAWTCRSFRNSKHNRRNGLYCLFE